MKILIKSKAFWTGLVDALVGIVFLVVGSQWPEYSALVKQIWVLLQPVVLAIIAAFATEDCAVKVARLIK